MKSTDQPIIKIVKKAEHGGHHGGAWKVAYADFVTAMMAFFLVMWILGLSQDKREAIAAYFKDPIGINKQSGAGAAKVAIAPSTLSLKTMARGNGMLKEQERRRFEDVRRAMQQAIKNAADLHGLENHIEITITSEGLRIELIDNAESLFFESGRSELKPRTVKLLQMISSVIKGRNSVVIEGHTDSRPYSGGQAGYSNFELSADRANSARRVMDAGLLPHQIASVRGYADSRLRVPTDPFAYANRRISILVQFTDPDLPEKLVDEQKLPRQIAPDPIHIGPPPIGRAAQH